MRTAILLLFMVLVFASTASSQTPDDYLILPGARIGKWTLKMSLADLRRMNGSSGISEMRVSAGMEPSLDARRDRWVYAWSPLALGAVTYDRKKVEALFAGAAGGGVPYKTDRGILLLQSQRSDIVKVYGKPTAVLKAASVGIFDLIYDKIGLAFQVLDPSGTIRTIGVFQPGGAKNLWKF